MSQWRSPLLSCDGDAVVIPVGGWYALCFGMESVTGRRRLAEDGFCVHIPRYTLTITSPDVDEYLAILRLPLQHIGNALEHAEGRELSDLHIGKLVYFTAGCSLVTASADMNRDEPEATSEESPRWCVIHHPSEPNETTLAGTLATGNKTLVCSFCVRSFPTLRGLKSHIQVMHIQLRPTLKRRRSGNGSDEETSTQPQMPESMYERALEVAYQDAYMAIVVKPQGMPVHGARPSLLRSNLLMALVCSADEIALLPKNDALGKPRPVHRLDSPTGGLLVVAKTRSAEKNLRNAFMNRDCRKRYRALVTGKLTLTLQQAHFVIDNDYGVIDSPVSGKASKTLFQVVRHVQSTTLGGGWLTEVDLWPVSGRRHQLRRHMKLIGHYILGDRRYSGKSNVANNEVESEDDATGSAIAGDDLEPAFPEMCNATDSRLCLWAMEITLPHPSTGDSMTAQMSEPEWLQVVIRQEENAFAASLQVKPLTGTESHIRS